MRDISILTVMFMVLTGCTHNLSLKITDMGAMADPEFDNALIINVAIDSCNRSGGGTVVSIKRNGRSLAGKRQFPLKEIIGNYIPLISNHIEYYR